MELSKFRFNENDDMLLLVQVNADRPYHAGPGNLMKQWDQLAAKLVSIDNFRPKHADGKTCQARFKKLLRAHELANKASQKKSGISEEATDEMMLLDDILADVNDLKDQKLKAKEEREKSEESKKAAGFIVREQAISRLKKRERSNEAADEGSPARPSKAARDQSTPLKQMMEKLDASRASMEAVLAANSKRTAELLEIMKTNQQIKGEEREERMKELEADREERRSRHELKMARLQVEADARRAEAKLAQDQLTALIYSLKKT